LAVGEVQTDFEIAFNAVEGAKETFRHGGPWRVA
jgi:hypothetical protein